MLSSIRDSALFPSTAIVLLLRFECICGLFITDDNRLSSGQRIKVQKSHLDPGSDIVLRVLANGFRT